MSAIFEDETFDRWYCDPPYNEQNAFKMYDCKLPEFRKLLREGARVIKPGSLMFFLIGPQNYQICPPEIESFGNLMTIVPNNELRCLNIYHKKHTHFQRL